MPEEQIEKPPLIEQTETVTTRWWIAAAPDMDVYRVYVARYHEKEPANTNADGSVEYYTPWAEYLNADGHWEVHAEGTPIPASLILPGSLLHTLANLEVLNRDFLAESLRELAVHIATKVIMLTTEADSTADLMEEADGCPND